MTGFSAISTSLGAVLAVEAVADGILDVMCARGDGIWLSAERNAQIPERLRQEDGWYGEEVAFAIPTLVFADAFRARAGAWGDRVICHARYLLEDLYPTAWRTLAGQLKSDPSISGPLQEDYPCP